MNVIEREKVRAAYDQALSNGCSPEDAISAAASSLCIPEEVVRDVVLEESAEAA